MTNKEWVLLHFPDAIYVKDNYVGDRYAVVSEKFTAQTGNPLTLWMYRDGGRKPNIWQIARRNIDARMTFSWNVSAVSDVPEPATTRRSHGVKA